MQVILTEQEYSDLKNAAVIVEAKTLKQVRDEVDERARKALPALEATFIRALRNPSPYNHGGPAGDAGDAMRVFFNTVFPAAK